MRQQATCDPFPHGATSSPRRRCAARVSGRIALVAVGMLMPLFTPLITGCGAKVLVPNEADALREELAARTDERDAARARVRELETELTRATASSETRINPEAAAATPALAAVAISSLSSARTTRDGVATLAVVVVPTDGLGRFLQMTGTLEISSAVLIPGAAPEPLPARTIGPKDLRECYRSGFLGTHYTVEFPVEWTPRAGMPATGVAVSTRFTDGWTGKTFASTATVPVIPNTRTAATSNSAPVASSPR